jgi:Bacterial Ig-like domain (group 2)/Abnormal spindle-like microcephaly-assoc'd, ASPM-SPD-2-Hydin/PQQ-like domain
MFRPISVPRRLMMTVAVVAAALSAWLFKPVRTDYASVPQVTVPCCLSFPTRLIHTTSSPENATLTNNQSSPLAINSIVAGGDFSQTNTCDGSVPAGSQCSIRVTFAPTAAGVRTGTITVIDSASNSPQVINLTGTALDVAFDKASYGFGQQIINKTSAAKILTLTNYGSDTKTINSATISGNFAQTNNCGSSLGPGASCTFTVTFTPLSAGSQQGTISVNDSGFRSPHTAKLVGVGETVALAPPAGVDFPRQMVDTMSPPTTVTLTNYDTNPLTIYSVAASGDIAQTNNCGGSLAAGSHCSINVFFIPLATGTRSGKLAITDSAYGSPQTEPFQGTGILPALQSLSVSPSSLSLALGQNHAFDALGAFSDGSVRNLTGAVFWNSSNPSVAAFQGNVAVPQAQGSATVTATSGVISGSASLKVSTVTVSPHLASIPLTQTEQFNANQSVTWYVDGIAGGNSTVGTITSSGLYSPPSTAGPHTISVTATSDPTQSAQASITVTDYPGTFTYNNDNLRTSWNQDEVVLSPSNVNPDQFGKLFSYAVDGQIYAQPLYVDGVNIPGQGYHDVVYVATENDTVYAFDADGLASVPLWQDSFIDASSGVTTLKGNCAIGPQWGITATPVIDPTTGTLYVTAKTAEPSGNKTVQSWRLHALDLATGAEKFGGPVLIEASVPGTGTGSSGGSLPFLAQYEYNRPGLLLVNEILYIAFGASGDEGPNVPYHHGWVFAYDTQTLNQLAAYSTSPNAWGASVWQSGGGLGADAAGNVYFMTGNGWFDANTGGADYGFSFEKLTLNAGSLTVADYFAPKYALDDYSDLDLGSGGPLLLPDQTGPYPHLLISGGKDGDLYLLNRDNLGQYNGSIVQFFSGISGGLWGKPVYALNHIYVTAAFGVFYNFSISNGLLTIPPLKVNLNTGFPGPVPAISSNGSTNGILWMIQPAGTSCTIVPARAAVLRALDPVSAAELYNSSQAGNRDMAGPAVKFAVPTVANGKVYVGTESELDVYGLFSQ